MSRLKPPSVITPGPIHEATARAYFARGSAEKLVGNHWRLFCFVLLFAQLASSAAIWQMVPLKTVEVYVATKQEGGRLTADELSGKWVPDQDMILYFLSSWTSNLTEVNAATWERTTSYALEFTVNAAADQVRDFLRRQENNPALLLRKNPNFVRTYELVSANIIDSGSALIRYRTTSRHQSGTAPDVVHYAITINYTRIKPTTRKQALSNPSGLAITSFNISEESLK